MNKVPYQGLLDKNLKLAIDVIQIMNFTLLTVHGSPWGRTC